jgi:hypothetical protein
VIRATIIRSFGRMIVVHRHVRTQSTIMPPELGMIVALFWRGGPTSRSGHQLHGLPPKRI